MTSSENRVEPRLKKRNKNTKTIGGEQAVEGQNYNEHEPGVYEDLDRENGVTAIEWH